MMPFRSTLFIFILWPLVSRSVDWHSDTSKVDTDDIEQVLSYHRENGSPIRVAFVHHAMHMGGVERQILLTCEALRLVDPNSTLFRPQIVLFQARPLQIDLHGNHPPNSDFDLTTRAGVGRVEDSCRARSHPRVPLSCMDFSRGTSGRCGGAVQRPRRAPCRQRRHRPHLVCVRPTISRR